MDATFPPTMADTCTCLAKTDLAAAAADNTRAALRQAASTRAATKNRLASLVGWVTVVQDHRWAEAAR